MASFGFAILLLPAILVGQAISYNLDESRIVTDDKQSTSKFPTVKIDYNPDRYRVNTDSPFVVNFIITFVMPEQNDIFNKDTPINMVLTFKPTTQSPQFNIINILNQTSIELNSYDKFTSSIQLEATYIGHATLELDANIVWNDKSTTKLLTKQGDIHITAIREEGLLDKIFFSSVIMFITISYINLGAQIDTDNVHRLRERPHIIVLGFLIGATVMPLASYIGGYIFFQEQPMYRIGSFIYAIGPAASASVLWTVMFDADKELALGLQIASTIGALVTMPVLLYAMDKSIDLEEKYTIKVPYMNLARQLVLLLVALLVGSRLVGRSKRAKQLSQKIFRPLTLFVLLFIIVFSSIVYWYIYKMFDWHITKMAVVVTLATYILSGFLGYLINRDIDHMITMSINSTYRNSGVAFAALVVAFEAPDTFIAYVPCLTQVVTTSLVGLVFLSIRNLKNSCQHKSQEFVPA